MAQELRQSTEYNIKIGPFVDVGDGFTPETGITIDAADEAEILKANTTGTLAIAGTLTAITNCDGWYYLTLSAGDTDELGPLTIVIQDDSACLPVFKEFEVVEQNYWDTKYNSTGSMKSTLTSAEYTTVTSFRATGFSTFDPANDGVSLTSAVYTSIGDFKATGFSTFDPASTGVTLGSAVYSSINDFKASGFSTFNPASDGVSLSSAIYTAISDFKATGFSTFDPAATGVTLGSAAYTGINDFKATSVSLSSAVYTSIADFKATGFSTFDPASSAVSITAASVDAVHDEVVEGTVTLRQALRLVLSALTAKVSGGGTTTITFRDIGDSKDRLVMTVDSNGNRTAIGTRDGS
jgi:hypothetical protein